MLLFLIAPALPFSHPPTPSHAQQVRAHLSADSVKVGERFRLSLVADHNFMLEARFPTPQADSGAAAGRGASASGERATRFGDLVVLALRDSSHRYLGRAGMRRDSVVYEVTTFALDTARVAPISVAFVQSGGDTVRAATEERLLAVESVLAPGVRAGRDTAQLRPLAPPAEFPRPLWPWLLGAAGLLALAALLLYLWRSREQEEQEPRLQGPPVPPAEDARRRLRRLEEETDLADPAAAKAFYTALSRTLRRYLMRRLGLRAFRSTTAELVAALRARAPEGPVPKGHTARGDAPPGHAWPDHAARRVERVLERADLAKFADQRPPAETRREALADARAAIDAIEDALQPARPPVGERAAGSSSGTDAGEATRAEEARR